MHKGGAFCRCGLHSNRKFGSGPPSHFIFGHTTDFAGGVMSGLKENKPFKFVREWHDKYGPLVKVDSFGMRNAILVGDPTLVKYIARNDPSRFTKGSSYNTIKRGWLDGSLVVSEGGEWRRKRNVYNSAFKIAAVRSYAPIFKHIAEVMSVDWQMHAECGQDVDAVKSFNSIAMEAIGRAGFGSPGMGADDNVYAQAFNSYLKTLQREREPLMLALPDRVKHFITRQRGQHHLDTMTLESRRIIGDARASACVADSTRKNLVSLMQEAMQVEGIELSTAELACEANLFLFAGHDTTSATLAWVWAMMARHPEAQQRAYEEVAAVPEEEVLQELSDPRNMPHLNAIIKETLRLYGPAAMVIRKSKYEENLGNFIIPAGTNFVPSLWAIHRDTAVFDEPDAFKPERWTEEEDAKKMKQMQDHWMPFMIGARSCIGQLFSMMELRTVTATMLRKFVVAARECETQSHSSVNLFCRVVTFGDAGLIVCGVQLYSLFLSSLGGSAEPGGFAGAS